MKFQSLEAIILRRLCAYAMSRRCLCNDIEEFDKYRLNNDFEYEWKKRSDGRWVVECSTDITCWDCISQAKHFLLDAGGYVDEAYCDICLLNQIIE